MCDASDYAMRAILGRWKVKFSVIYYARKTLNDAQLNYFTTKRASNYGLCLWYISILSYGIKGHSLHKSCSVKIFDDKEGCQSETDLLVFFTVRFDLESKVRNEVKILYLTTYLDFSLRSEKSQLKSKRSSPISRFLLWRIHLGMPIFWITWRKILLHQIIPIISGSNSFLSWNTIFGKILFFKGEVHIKLYDDVFWRKKYITHSSSVTHYICGTFWYIKDSRKNSTVQVLLVFHIQRWLPACEEV